MPINIWIMGLSGSGKTTIANYIKKNYLTEYMLLDGDEFRNGISKDLGFSPGDRMENIRRCAEICLLANRSGVSTICSFITPLDSQRNMLRDILGDSLLLCYLKCSVEECIRRDVKGLYKKAINGEIQNFTGIDSVFDIPTSVDLTIDTEIMTIDESIKCMLKAFPKEFKDYGI